VNVPLHQLAFGLNPPAGMDLSVIGHWAMLPRKTAEPVDPPILIGAPCLACGVHRVTDGRHRVSGGWVAGRSYIDAKII
jgi:hypothetical protein